MHIDDPACVVAHDLAPKDVQESGQHNQIRISALERRKDCRIVVLTRLIKAAGDDLTGNPRFFRPFDGVSIRIRADHLNDLTRTQLVTGLRVDQRLKVGAAARNQYHNPF